MKKCVFFSMVVIILSIGLINCKSNKVSCPAYGGSNTPPGAIPKGSKTTSGVLPTDGRGKRTRVPQ